MPFGEDHPLKHVAIIMDGNGRWANSRFRPRVWGHVRGSHVVNDIVEEAVELGIRALTLYSFSTENWSRPALEVTTLFRLLKKFIQKERKKIIDNQIRFKVIGDIGNLPDDVVNLVREVENTTKDFQGLKLNLAVGYGGRTEIINAINQCVKEHSSAPITEEDFVRHLYDSESGDVDLMIRTGGDKRISNFLLWQMAYAELYFTDIMWPEFTRDEFRKICNDTLKKERRFGNISNEDNSKKLKDIKELAKKNKGNLNRKWNG